MEIVSSEYNEILETKTSLSIKNKIVVDEIEYTGKLLVTFPKVSHKTSKMIGGFPIKTCNFEIYNFDNSIDFIGKEIYVYKGLMLPTGIEYVLQGIFVPQENDVKTNISKKTISFNNIQDKGQFFDIPYVSKLDWSVKHTGLEIIQEICDYLKIKLETPNFNWANYEFEQPNFSQNISCREVVSRMAEIGGEIAYISRIGGLKIVSQNITNILVPRKRYVKCTKEKEYLINTVSLGKEGMEDNIIFPDSFEGERVTWNILDNPFVDLNPKDMVEKVSNYIIGKNIIPFTLTEFVDGFYFDINDVIQVIDKNGNIFSGVILNYETTSRIKSNVGAETQSQQNVDYNLAGSSKKSINDVKVLVDHIDKKVTVMGENVTNTTNKVAKFELEFDGIKQSVSSTEKNIQDMQSQIDSNSANTDNKFQEFNTKFNDYALKSNVVTLQENVTQLQTSTYSKTEVNSILEGTYTDENGQEVVTRVVKTTSGTFDENGMHYEKTGAETKSNINEKGFGIYNQNDNEILFAGYDDERKESVVRSDNFYVKKFLVLSEKSRFEDYKDGTGCFWIGGS